MASRDLKDLHPRMKEKAVIFIQECIRHKIDFIITCTWRSGIEQNILYEQGRTKPGRIVTNARAGQSKHNFTIDGKPASKAFDVVPVVNGKPVWDSRNPVWQELGAIGLSIGLDWAGVWSKFKEYPHFQLKEENYLGSFSPSSSSIALVQ